MRTRHHHGHHHPAPMPAVHPAALKHPYLGNQPTNSQKIIYIANKLGLKAIAKMQGSSFNLFDTVDIGTNTNAQTLTFFANSNGKAAQFSNFQNGTLKAGEAMIIEQLSFFLISKIGALSSSATPISDIIPLGTLQDTVSQLGGGLPFIQYPGSLKLGQFQISIANQTVSKQYLTFEQVPDFNPKTTGVSKIIMSTADLPANGAGPNGQNTIPVEAPPVLPPNLSFEVDYSIGALGTVTPPSGTTLALMCVAGRFGTRFSSKGTF